MSVSEKHVLKINVKLCLQYRIGNLKFQFHILASWKGGEWEKNGGG